jgi:hypothetical protein
VEYLCTYQSILLAQLPTNDVGLPAAEVPWRQAGILITSSTRPEHIGTRGKVWDIPPSPSFSRITWCRTLVSITLVFSRNLYMKARLRIIQHPAQSGSNNCGRQTIL